MVYDASWCFDVDAADVAFVACVVVVVVVVAVTSWNQLT